MSKAFTREDGPTEEVEPPEEPIARGPRHITPEGFRRLQDELSTLWRGERPRVTAEVSAAAAQGDRSENAEYIYGKKRLREIDRRVRFLTKLLERLTIVPPTAERGVIRFGCWATVEGEDGKRSTYRLVGPDEFDVRRGFISVDSPLARALVGRRVGETVTVHRPMGPVELEVLRIDPSNVDGPPPVGHS